MEADIDKRVSLYKYYLFFLMLSFSLPVLASVKLDFEQGVSYFVSGKYLQAVKKFEAAESKGLKSAALYYNLASSYFRLEKYSQSRVYFTRLLKQSKMKSLAEYNLGLIDLKQQNYVRAKSYFVSVINENADDKLVTLATIQINKLKSRPEKRPWSAYLSGIFGYDNNINAAPVGIAVNESDFFIDYVVTFDYVLSGRRKSGWIADVLIINTNYLESGKYDFSQSGLGLKYAKKYGSWQYYYKTGFDKFRYSHEDYQSIIKLGYQAKYNYSRENKLYLKYRYDQVTSDSPRYDYLEGWRQRAKIEFRNYKKTRNFRAFYELELNDREDFVSTVTGDEFSYSPTRHTLRGKYTQLINNRWNVTGDIAYRTSDYPATVTETRNDERTKLAIYAAYSLGKYITFNPKIEYTDNSSSGDIYDYSRMVVSLGLSAFF